MNSRKFFKDPDSVLDYEIDWRAAPPGPWLKDGDEIATSEWIIEEGEHGLEKHNEAHTETTTTIWLKEGVAGNRVMVTNRIVTAQGRTADRSLAIEIRDR